MLELILIFECLFLFFVTYFSMKQDLKKARYEYIELLKSYNISIQENKRLKQEKIEMQNIIENK